MSTPLSGRKALVTGAGIQRGSPIEEFDPAAFRLL